MRTKPWAGKQIAARRSRPSFPNREAVEKLRERFACSRTFARSKGLEKRGEISVRFQQSAITLCELEHRNISFISILRRNQGRINWQDRAFAKLDTAGSGRFAAKKGKEPRGSGIPLGPSRGVVAQACRCWGGMGPSPRAGGSKSLSFLLKRFCGDNKLSPLLLLS